MQHFICIAWFIRVRQSHPQKPLHHPFRLIPGSLRVRNRREAGGSTARFVPVANRPAEAGGNPGKSEPQFFHSISGGRWLVQSASGLRPFVTNSAVSWPPTLLTGIRLGTIRLHRVSLISIPLTLAYQWVGYGQKNPYFSWPGRTPWQRPGRHQRV